MNKKFQLGIIGGGQLGRMLLYSAFQYGLVSTVLDPDPQSSCAAICADFVCGDFLDFETVLQFGLRCDVVSIEFENINVAALFELQQRGVNVYPDPTIIAMIQDKGFQKCFLREHGFPTAPFRVFDAVDDVRGAESLLPGVQKLCRAGYDGRGVVMVDSVDDLIPGSQFVLEQRADIFQELSIIVSRNLEGQCEVFDPVEMGVSSASQMLEYLVVPTDLDTHKLQEMKSLAISIAQKINLVGILAIEMFLNKSGELWINEMSPRPHNSGHHSIEACETSQYDQLIRAIMGWSLGATTLRYGAAGILNLVGPATDQITEDFWGQIKSWVSVPRVFVHHYGKAGVREGRKIGHITVLGDTRAEVYKKLMSLKQRIKK